MVRPIENEDTGIKVLYPSTNPSIDILAIHGLGAHPDDTWTENIHRDSSETSQWVSWLDAPKMLPEAIPNACIMRFGYRSQWLGSENIKTGAVSMSGLAERLLKELERNRKDPNRPLIFIAHSFGGLVLMNALRLSFDSPEKWLNPFAATVGLVFLGTPFRGRYGMDYRDMVKAAILKTREDQVWPESLEFALPGNEHLRETVRRFLDMRNKDYPIPLWCFYETLPSDVGKVVGGPSEEIYVVPVESACLDESEGIHTHPLERDHYSLNKFGSPSEEGYIAVRDAIVLIAEGAPNVLKHRSKELSRPIHQGAPDSSIKSVFYHNISSQQQHQRLTQRTWNPFERFSRPKKPVYVLIDHIPASVGPSLLGRIVVGIEHPTDNYRPKKPLETVRIQPHSGENTTSISKSDQTEPLGTSEIAASKSNQSGFNVTGQTKGKTDPGQGSNAKEVTSANTDKAPRGADQSGSTQIESAAVIEAIQREEVQVEDSALSFLFSQINNFKTQAKLRQILGVTVEEGNAMEVGMTSKFVRTRNLTQHYDTLKALLAHHRQDILDLAPLAKRKRLYMVVGFKAAVDSDMHQPFGEKRSVSLQAAFRAGAAIQAASHSLVDPGNAVDAKADAEGQGGKSGKSMNTSGKMLGEQIFAIRYRILNLSIKNESEPIKHGDIVRVRHDEGVYDGNGKELVFEDDDYSDDSDLDEWQDEEIVPSLGSIKNEARYVNEVVTANFDQ